MNRKTRRVRTFTRLHKKKRSNKEGREGIHAWDDGGRWKGNGVVDYVSSLRDSKDALECLSSGVR